MNEASSVEIPSSLLRRALNTYNAPLGVSKRGVVITNTAHCTFISTSVLQDW
jgi:hypothetical protein